MGDKRQNRQARIRTQSGIYLIELIAALFISGLLAVALGASLAQTIRTSQIAQNQFIPSVLTVEIIDRMRALPYSYLASVSTGTYQIPINYGDNVPALYGFQVVPLAIDDSSIYQWTDNLQPYKFQGQANVEVTPDPTGAGVSITASIKWADPGSTQNRQYNLSTYISQYGIHE